MAWLAPHALFGLPLSKGERLEPYGLMPTAQWCGHA